jgi:putative heme-binding domain-containing protein
MPKALSKLHVVLCGALMLPAAANAQKPEQAERGQNVFVQKDCASCHRLEGRGTAIGPDLSVIGRLSPKAIATAVLATRTAHVATIKLKSGQKFPAMQATDDQKTVRVFDLSQKPPALRVFERSEIEASTNNESWTHPPATDALTDEELADVIAYLRWVTVRDRKGVAADDVR